MSAYYNEIDPYAAAWLRNLVAAGYIADGVVDERSIVDVSPSDLRDFTQCHFFAGAGVWSHALRSAGWADDRPVWTGSCPCQPFSAAGKGDGFADERHLWPAFYHLIRECGPSVVLGEQVASKDGLAWIDLVQADMEGTGYASGAVDLCAAGVGAPHIRQRLWWCAERLEYADGAGSFAGLERPASARHGRSTIAGSGSVGVANADDDRFQGRSVIAVRGTGRWKERHAPGRSGAPLAIGAVNPPRGRRGVGRGPEQQPESEGRQPGDASCTLEPGPTNGLWRDADWLFCRDGKWRPVEPGTFPLAHGAASRVGRLRAYGNAIVAQAAEEFIRAYMTC